MNWFKEFVFANNLKARIQRNLKDKKEIKNLSKFIGILVDESAIDSIGSLEKEIAEWKKKGKKVEVFRFRDEKEIAEEISDTYCRKQINWAGIPKGEHIDRFIDTTFDILITINPDQKKSLQYINAVSKAKFKIGLEAEDLQYNNLIIDCKQSSQVKTSFKEIQLTLDKLAI